MCLRRFCLQMMFRFFDVNCFASHILTHCRLWSIRYSNMNDVKWHSVLWHCINEIKRRERIAQQQRQQQQHTDDDDDDNHHHRGPYTDIISVKLLKLCLKESAHNMTWAHAHTEGTATEIFCRPENVENGIVAESFGVVSIARISHIRGASQTAQNTITTRSDNN